MMAPEIRSARMIIQVKQGVEGTAHERPRWSIATE
jgi:hypothetical protein